ncbi:hypothetical protein BH11MYX4_BH11MYX4_55200 [soil metagenome]
MWEGGIASRPTWGLVVSSEMLRISAEGFEPPIPPAASPALPPSIPASGHRRMHAVVVVGRATSHVGSEKPHQRNRGSDFAEDARVQVGTEARRPSLIQRFSLSRTASCPPVREETQTPALRPTSVLPALRVVTANSARCDKCSATRLRVDTRDGRRARPVRPCPKWLERKQSRRGRRRRTMRRAHLRRSLTRRGLRAPLPALRDGTGARARAGGDRLRVQALPQELHARGGPGERG